MYFDPLTRPAVVSLIRSLELEPSLWSRRSRSAEPSPLPIEVLIENTSPLQRSPPSAKHTAHRPRADPVCVLISWSHADEDYHRPFHKNGWTP